MTAVCLEARTAYAAHTRNLTPTVDIAIVDTSLASLFLLADPIQASVMEEFIATLTITVANGGNLLEATDVFVSLYDGTPAADCERLASAPRVSLGGCGALRSLASNGLRRRRAIFAPILANQGFSPPIFVGRADTLPEAELLPVWAPERHRPFGQ